MKLRTLIIAAAGLTLAAGAAGAASAETPWQAHHHHALHHARVELNHRLANQSRTIHKAYRKGELTTSQARTLLARDRTIRMKEQRFAREHHGRMTHAEQVKLNHQETALHRHVPA